MSGLARLFSAAEQTVLDVVGSREQEVQTFGPGLVYFLLFSVVWARRKATTLVIL